MEAPVLSAFLHPTEESMSREQRGYLEWFSLECLAGRFPDVNAYIDYAYFHVHRLLRDWKTLDLKEAHNHLMALRRAYTEYAAQLRWETDKKAFKTFSENCFIWAADCLILAHEYETYLEFTKPSDPFRSDTHRSNERLNISYRLGLPPSSIDLLRITDSPFTKYTREHPEEYLRILTTILEEEALKNGSWLERLLEAGIEQLVAYEKDQIALEESNGTIEKFFKQRSEHLLSLKMEGLHVLEDDSPDITVFREGAYGHYLFSGHQIIPSLKWEGPYYCFYVGAHRPLLPLFREAENELRRRHSIPEVGQGWISETALYRALKNAFPQTEVVQHGSPDWLGRQHLDIGFPSWQIGVEYHGTQHFKPVEFFGGVNAFEETKKRDQKKVRLCREHGLKLFIVTEDSSPDDLIDRIGKHAVNRTNST